MSTRNGGTAAPAKIVMPDADSPAEVEALRAQVNASPHQLPPALLGALNATEAKTVESLQERMMKVSAEYDTVAAHIGALRDQVVQHEQDQLRRQGKAEVLREQIGDVVTHATLRQASRDARVK